MKTIRHDYASHLHSWKLLFLAGILFWGFYLALNRAYRRSGLEEAMDFDNSLIVSRNLEPADRDSSAG